MVAYIGNPPVYCIRVGTATSTFGVRILGQKISPKVVQIVRESTEIVLYLITNYLVVCV